MTLQTRDALTTTINTNIPTNTAGGVTATNHRAVEENLADGIWQRLVTAIDDTDSPYTADPDTEQIIIADSTSGTITINLPAAGSSTNKLYTVKHVGGANNVVLDGNASETIDGATTHTLSTQYEVVSIVCDGTEWWIISN